MTHDPDQNVTVPHGTENDAYVALNPEWWKFELVGDPQPVKPREVWPGIEDDVRELERMLK